MKNFFSMARARGWSTETLAGSFLFARGIRGREGVEVLYEFCAKFTSDWRQDHVVMSFVDHFESRWRQEVKRTGMVSALSHQEHLHAGLSGMNYVETLKEAENRMLLFGNGGVAHRLAPFFEEPENLNAELLLDFYTALVEQPFPMATQSYYVQLEGARILGKRPRIQAAAVQTRVPLVKSRVPKVSDGSYNSMDFLRCFSNVMTSVFDAPEVLFTDALWNKMLECQRKHNEIKDLLGYFDMNVGKANEFISEWRTEGMNWTTFLICLCEVRQPLVTIVKVSYGS